MPIEDWNEKHLPRTNDGFFTHSICKLWKLCQIGIRNVHLALNCETLFLDEFFKLEPPWNHKNLGTGEVIERDQKDELFFDLEWSFYDLKGNPLKYAKKIIIRINMAKFVMSFGG